jgi:hypothetical protein
MSVRGRIAAALAGRLAAIRRANGYQTDMGARVFLWKRNPITEAEVPCLLAADTDLTRDETDVEIGMALNSLTFTVVAMISGATDMPEISDIEADIVSCLVPYRLGEIVNEVVALRFISSRIMMEQHENLVAAVQVTITVDYYTPEESI